MLIALLLLLEIALLAVMFTGALQRRIISSLLRLLSVVTALHMLTRNQKGAFKLSLIFLILLFPLFGGAIYWLLHYQTETVGFRRRLAKVEEGSKESFLLVPTDFEGAKQAIPRHRKRISYLQSVPRFPIYKDTATRYFPTGGGMLDALLADIASAERYIFLEYFIIEEGEMWDRILEALRERVAAGIDVRVIYDDIGCLLTLPEGYDKKLRAYGIACERFNRFRPLLSSLQNNRDHRKITVIDGRIAYTGGINLADEYINKAIKYGHWKDAAIRLEGVGAWSFTVIFLEMWNFLTRKNEDHTVYLPSHAAPTVPDTWVQPYCDSPMDRENVSEHIYLQMIQEAEKSLYITTPYLMVDDSMLSALKLAAKSGVDVRIITPRHPDKRLVHFTTRSYYRDLISAGVHVYEYTKGFIHSKNLVVDDTAACVGTSNLDFRSLYLHFECGVCIYGHDTVRDVKEDHLHTLRDCEEITMEKCRANVIVRMLQTLLRLFAPLM